MYPLSGRHGFLQQHQGDYNLTAISAYLLEERIQPTGEDLLAPPTFMILSTSRLLPRFCRCQYNRFPFLPEPRKWHYSVTTLQLYPIRKPIQTALSFRANFIVASLMQPNKIIRFHLFRRLSIRIAERATQIPSALAQLL